MGPPLDSVVRVLRPWGGGWGGGGGRRVPVVNSRSGPDGVNAQMPQSDYGRGVLNPREGSREGNTQTPRSTYQWFSIAQLEILLSHLFPGFRNQSPPLQKVYAKRTRYSPAATSHTTDSGCFSGLYPCRMARRNRPRVTPCAALNFLSQEFRIDLKRIQTIPNSRQVHGGKADVERAVLLPDDRCPGSRPSWVALKKIRFDEDTDDQEALVPFVHEIAILSNLRHRNLIQFLGFVEDSNNGIAWIVLSWQAKGTLRDYIQSKDWGFTVRLSLILNVISGVLYLHTLAHPICHGDLKSPNILVGDSGRAVISDFGSARGVEPDDIFEEDGDGAQIFSPAETGCNQPQVHLGEDDKSFTLSGPAWTLRWAAPELLEGTSPSLKSDIWAVGWICWEILTGKLPFYNAPNESQVVLKIMRGCLPALLTSGRFSPIQTLITFMRSCWTIDPNVRPPLDVLVV